MVAKVENSSFSGKFAMIHERCTTPSVLGFLALGKKQKFVS